MTTPWTHTHTGRALDLLAPKPEQIAIADIAHAISRLCRYTGHVGAPHYSVAEHSVHVADRVLAETGDRYLAWCGLMHDAHEAYVGDVASPLKEAMRKLMLDRGSLDSPWDELERRVERAVRERFGCSLTMPASVKTADLRMLATEAPQLLPWPPPRSWGALPEPYQITLAFWPAPVAEEQFSKAIRRFAPKAYAEAAA